MSKKMGFWSVFAIISGAQIGSGVLMLPTALAPFGFYGLVGWIISACGALSLSIVFAALCTRFPYTGGPHVYIHHLFNDTAAFFTGWTYWVISWVSTTVLIIASVGYMRSFIPWHDKLTLLYIELILLTIITILNLYGAKTTGIIELILTIIKFIPLTVIPLTALWYFNPMHFIVHNIYTTSTSPYLLGQATLLTLWGFIGLESATTPADSVENPSTTIPKAILWGTLSTALLYILNYLGIAGLVPPNILMNSSAPYVDAAQYLYGGNWHLLISCIASIICITSLNAWILTSGHIALGLSQDAFMPALFGITNKHGAPLWSIIISSLGIVPLLVLTANDNIATQVISIIDVSVISFVCIYFICSIGFATLLYREPHHFSWYHYICAAISILFCLWIISETLVSTLAIASLFTISGIPLYFFWYKNKKCTAAFKHKEL